MIKRGQLSTFFAPKKWGGGFWLCVYGSEVHKRGGEPIQGQRVGTFADAVSFACRTALQDGMALDVSYDSPEQGRDICRRVIAMLPEYQW